MGWNRICKRIFGAAFLSLALWTAGCKGGKPALEADPRTRRVTPSGPVLGAQSAYGADVWLGLPFAQPPVGALRWRAPRPITAWSETRRALASGQPCPQYASPFGGVDGNTGEIVGSEDCLTLNVYAPRFATDAVPRAAQRLPVMVWIHGGANAIGAAGSYEGGHLAVSQQVIVVTVHYRLGPLGWFRHPALREDAADAAEQSGNFANLDHIAALQWVRQNIGAFGGDPDNVTIFGESAGARNVTTLLLAPQAKGLFQRAIIQSGFPGCNTAVMAENAVEDGGHPRSSTEFLLTLLSQEFDLDREGARQRLATMTPLQVRNYLRGKSTAEFMGAFGPVGQRPTIFPQLFNDGTVIPEACTDAFATGAWNKVPVLVGANRDEARLFMFANPRFIQRRFGLVPRFVIDEKDYVIVSDYASRGIRYAGTDMLAERFTKSEPDVYVYRFDWDELPTIFGANLGVMLGASHGFEIPFVFGHFDLGREAARLFAEETLPSRLALSEAMMSYWGAFAREGKPGQGSDGKHPAWAAWHAKSEQPQRMVFDTPRDGGVRMLTGADSLPVLLADIEADARLTQAARCELLQGLAVRSTGYSRADYEARSDCKAYPIAMRIEL